jgi:hypothetical protein
MSDPTIEPEVQSCPFCDGLLVPIPQSTRINMMLGVWVQEQVKQPERRRRHESFLDLD